MTALRLPHLSGPRHTGRPLSDLVGMSIRTGRCFRLDGAGSTAAQLRAMERFAASLHS